MTYGEAIDQAFADRPAASAPLDVDAAMSAGLEALAAKAPPWGDESAHVTDLSGLCDRETWARRSGVPREPFDTATRVGFELGHASEKLLLDAIEAGLPAGWSLVRQATIRLTLDEEGALYGTTLLDGDPVLPKWFAETPKDRIIVGHIDAIICHGPLFVTVIDTKSTVWWSKNENGRQVWYPKGPPKQGHKIQVATYAMALGLKVAGLYELDLAGKDRRMSWFDVEPYRALIERRIVAVLHMTSPAAEEPVVLPNDWTYIRATRNSAGRITGGDSWACGFINRKGEMKRGYCSHTACPAHVLNTPVTL